MKAAHTPGPWVAKPPDGGQPSGDLVDLMDRDVRQSEYWFIDGPGDDVHGHMSEADARLIAAAPELLESLIYMRDCAESGEHQTSERWAQVQAVIKKLTGE